MEFRDKIVIITGSGRGIGRAIAMEYAFAGAITVIAETDPFSGASTTEEINKLYGKSYFIRTDVSKPDEIEELFKRIAEQFERIDIIINNTGISVWKSPYDITLEEWDQVINTNLRSTFLCSREAAKIMKKNGGGSIVNIASTRAFMSEPNSEAYAATKGGIVALTHAMAASLAPDRIRVNCISPGWIETGDYSLLKETDHIQHFSGRVGLPADIARACIFLTQEANSFINGTNLTIDGGMTRKMIYET